MKTSAQPPSGHHADRRLQGTVHAMSKVLATAAAPGMQDLIAARRVDNAANQLANDIHLSRAAAVAQDSALTVVGAIYAASVTLSGSGMIVQGTLINEGAYAGPAAPDLRFDADVLAALTHQTSSFARVSASWRDF
jgi:Tfp pilus assembly protein FimT